MSITHCGTFLYVTFFYADIVRAHVSLGSPTDGLIEYLYIIILLSAALYNLSFYQQPKLYTLTLNSMPE